MSKAQQTKAQQTKARILEGAIELFNEKGTKAVTTNHIAAAVGMSPGNLYYHFRNKEEIIRAIFAQMHEVGLQEYREINEERGPGSAVSMEETFLMIQRFNWRYRFFKRELAALVQSDPELKARFVASHRENLVVVRGAIEQSIVQGFLRDMPLTQRELLAEQIWMMALFWLNYLEVGGEEVTEESLQRGSAILRNMLLPYLSIPLESPQSTAEVFPEYIGKEKEIALRAYRNREGLTQKRLAEMTGIPQHHLSEMENGKRSIGKERAKKVAEALHCDYRQLI